MKKFTKICLILCGCSVLLGIVFLGVGTMLGARPGEYLRMANLDYFGFWPGSAERTWEDLEDLEDLEDPEDLEDLEDPEDLRDREAWKEMKREWHDQDHGHEHDGTYAYGWEIAEEDCEFDQTFTEVIRELEVQVSYGGIYLKSWDQEGIRVLAHDTSSAFQCFLDEDTLKIQEKKKRPKNQGKDLDLLILLPKSQLEELEVELGAGYLEAGELNAREVSLEMGAGECLVERICAEEKADLSAGAGRLCVKAFEGRELEGSCGAGELEICLDGAYEDYNYELSSAMGEIRLGNRVNSGIGSSESIANGASRKVELECGIGTVFVSFGEEQ